MCISYMFHSSHLCCYVSYAVIVADADAAQDREVERGGKKMDQV